jgi:Na+/serine symporter
MSEGWRQLVLSLAALWNLICGIGALVDPRSHFAQLYTAQLSLDDPLQAFFYQATWVNVIAWAIGYLLVARDAAARTPVLFAGGAGKIAYFGVALILYQSGVGTTMLLVAGVVDLVFAGLFMYILWLGSLVREVRQKSA